MPVVFANILQPLIDVFESLLKFFHDTVGASWGLSIILMTVVIRAILFPLTLKQFKSMQSLQRLSPEIKALQAKYKDDRQRLNQEMMKFYQENKVNPLGSCLPLLAQMPVFISLFYMLRKDLRIDICGQTAKACGDVVGSDLYPKGSNAHEFFFIPDITDRATGAVLVVLLVLYVGSQLLSSVMLSSPTMDQTQRRLMMFLPVAFVPFILNFPAGLMVYWITTNFWTVGQGLAVRRRYGHIGVPKDGEEESSPLPGKGSGDKGGSRAAKKVPAGATAAVATSGSTDSGKTAATGSAPRASAPPPPPRRKKKRSGRRR